MLFHVIQHSMGVLTDAFSGQKQVQFQSILGFGKENEAFNIQVWSLSLLTESWLKPCRPLHTSSTVTWFKLHNFFIVRHLEVIQYKFTDICYIC